MQVGRVRQWQVGSFAPGGLLQIVPRHGRERGEICPGSPLRRTRPGAIGQITGQVIEKALALSRGVEMLEWLPFEPGRDQKTVPGAVHPRDEAGLRERRLQFDLFVAMRAQADELREIAAALSLEQIFAPFLHGEYRGGARAIRKARAIARRTYRARVRAAGP